MLSARSVGARGQAFVSSLVQSGVLIRLSPSSRSARARTLATITRTPFVYKPVSFEENFTHSIAGHATTSATSAPILNPATLAPVGHAPLATRAQLDDAVRAAAAAFPAWAATPLAERQEAMHRLGDLFDQFGGELGTLLTREQGKPLRNHCPWEMGGSSAWFHAHAGMALADESAAVPGAAFATRYTPLGVGAAILPWNFPLILMVLKIAPALVTGNTVVIKPSPYTPLATLKFGELAQQVLPPGVLNVISGSDELGPWLSTHPGVAKVAFTGSTRTGAAVMRGAAAGIKRVTLELGGNDPAIVLPDVDPVKIAPALFQALFWNVGQVCVAAKRMYVHASVYDAVRDALVAHGRTLRLGDGLQDGVDLGPLQNRVQMEKVQELVEECRQAGLTMHTMGNIDPGLPGYFMPITLVDNPPEDARVVQDEPFGPIAPLLKWTDEEDVIRRANNSEYGLGASVWSNDLAHADRIARRLDAGTVWINTMYTLSPHAPFGGHKMSGLGAEGGRAALTAWTNSQVVATNTETNLF